jgi:hypothetical protein
VPIMFNTVLRQAGLSLTDVCLVRHQDSRAARGRTPYELWRDDRPAFDLYQSHQKKASHQKFSRPLWASFVGTHDNDTLFVGVYAAKYRGLLEHDTPWPHAEGIDKAGTCDVYDLSLHKAFEDLIGKLYVEWGGGFRAWVQHADKQDKIIRELRTEFKEPDFPGFLNFIGSLSQLNKLPTSWIVAFRSSRGVYLLTCPKTKEQYVGSATGGNGFWSRWQEYVQSGHGGNVGLISRDPSDYQVSILEVAGTASTTDDILTMEQRWKAKLQSKEMGLNRN